ncbi:MAG: BBE domain-containing protein [Pseudomonadota bacterium]
MTALLTPTLSDRQGFNRRWFANDDQLVVYRPTSSQEALSNVQDLFDKRYDPKSVQITCGRHCYEGFVYNSSTKAIIDLTGLRSYGTFTMRGVETVYFDVGYNNWDMYRVLNNVYQKTMPAGSCYSVGLGGHITGGGYGYFSRMYGLTIDDLTAADVIVVDPVKGPTRSTCSADSNADMFWAIRSGGGGQFGMITRYYFALEALPTSPSYLFVNILAWDWYAGGSKEVTLTQDQFNAIVNDTFFDQYCNQDKTLWNVAGILHGYHKDGGTINLVEIDSYGPDNDIPLQDYIQQRRERLADLTRRANDIAPLSDRDCTLQGHPYIARTRALGIETAHHAGDPGPDHIYTYLEGVQILNGSGPNRHGKYKSAYHSARFSTTMLEAAYQGLTANVTRPDTHAPVDMSSSLMQIDAYGGKINTIAPAETAIVQRSSIAKMQYQTYWETKQGPQFNDESLEQAHVQWIRDLYKNIYQQTGGAPSGTDLQGCYFNYPDIDIGSTDPSTPPLEDALTLYFGTNLPRLKSVAKAYNPDGWFSNSQSICRSVSSS